MIPSFTTPKLRSMLERAKGVPLLVAGDLILDEYLEGDARRISPEAPIPVMAVEKEWKALGGAAYVAALAASLGAEVRLAGVLGEDPAGDRLLELASELGLDSSLMVRAASRRTPLKTRVVARGQQLVRIDRESSEPLNGDLPRRLMAKLHEGLEGARGVIISDYGKGTLTKPLVQGLIGEARRRRIPVVVDPKPKSMSWYLNATLIKPNQAEAEAAVGSGPVRDEDFEELAGKVSKLVPRAEVLITRGPKGMALVRSKRPSVHIPTRAREVFDVTGAGDAATSALGLFKAAGVSTLEAAVIANLAGAVAVSRHGCWIFGPKEILKANGK